MVEPRFADDDRHHCKYREDRHALLAAAETVDMAYSLFVETDVLDDLAPAIGNLRAILSRIRPLTEVAP